MLYKHSLRRRGSMLILKQLIIKKIKIMVMIMSHLKKSMTMKKKRRIKLMNHSFNSRSTNMSNRNFKVILPLST